MKVKYLFESKNDRENKSILGAILVIEELAILLDVRLAKLNCLMEIWEEGQGEMGKCRQKIEEAIENGKNGK
jgi:hypothetical protein